jgi:hypothetical protein
MRKPHVADPNLSIGVSNKSSVRLNIRRMDRFISMTILAPLLRGAYRTNARNRSCDQ